MIGEKSYPFYQHLKWKLSKSCYLSSILTRDQNKIEADVLALANLVFGRLVYCCNRNAFTLRPDKIVLKGYALIWGVM